MPRKIDDFRYMLRGKPLKPLVNQQACLLDPIDIRGPGNDRALLLLHGFSSSPAVFRKLLPVFGSYDAVMCPALPGHGQSIADFSVAKGCDWLSAAEHACAQLMRNYQHVDVLGLSLGGLLACHLSQRFALNHLYLLAPALALQLNIPLSLKLAHVLNWLGFNYLRNQAGNIHLPHNSELAYRQLPIHAVIEILTLVNGFQFVVPQVSTDLFLGCFDEIVDSARVAALFLNAPNCTIHWLSNSAHVLPLDGDIDTIIACIHSGSR
jgi:carboxylesterase